MVHRLDFDLGLHRLSEAADAAVPGAISYSPSIVTMALSCIIYEIERDIGRES